jgi:hypothetical protein
MKNRYFRNNYIGGGGFLNGWGSLYLQEMWPFYFYFILRALSGLRCSAFAVGQAHDTYSSESFYGGVL